MSDENARVWVEWFGGSGYAMSYPWEHLETFESLEAAKNALVERYTSGYSFRQDFDYVNRDKESTFTPAVGEDCEMWVWYGDPMQYDEMEREHYPDSVIRLQGHRDDRGTPTAYVESA